MGALPKRRISTRRKGKRRINHRIALQSLDVCSQCQSPKKPHQACPECGVYKN